MCGFLPHPGRHQKCTANLRYLMFFEIRKQEVIFYSPNLGLQSVIVNSNNPDGARQLILEQYGNVDIKRVNSL